MVIDGANHYFLEAGDKRLYTVHYPGSEKGKAAIVCQPFGDEAVKSRRVLNHLCAAWAKRGCDVLILDYHGTGNSSGEFEELDWGGLSEDLGCGIAELRRISKKESVILAGLRLGATLAAMGAEQREKIDSLILIDPVVEPLTYLREALRANLATQMVVHGKVVFKRDELEERIRGGAAVDVNGYPVTKRFFDSVCGISLSRDVARFRGDVWIVRVSQLAKPKVPAEIEVLSSAYRSIGARCRVSSVRERPFWTELKENYTVASQLEAQTENMLS